MKALQVGLGPAPHGVHVAPHGSLHHAAHVPHGVGALGEKLQLHSLHTQPQESENPNDLQTNLNAAMRFNPTVVESPSLLHPEACAETNLSSQKKCAIHPNVSHWVKTNAQEVEPFATRKFIQRTTQSTCFERRAKKRTNGAPMQHQHHRSGPSNVVTSCLIRNTQDRCTIVLGKTHAAAQSRKLLLFLKPSPPKCTLQQTSYRERPHPNKQRASCVDKQTIQPPWRASAPAPA